MLEQTIPTSLPFSSSDFNAGLGQESATAEPLTGLVVKYNGKSQTLSPEEATALAQKGMNYPRILMERDAALARASALQEELSLLQNGSEPDPEACFKRRLEQNWLEFLQRYPEIREPRQQLSNEVWQAIEGGMSPCSAYLEHSNRALLRETEQLKNSLAALEKTRDARFKSPGSMTSAMAANNADPFTEGLMQGF